MVEECNHIGLAVQRIVTELMENVMERVLITDPFIAEVHHAAKPLYAAF